MRPAISYVTRTCAALALAAIPAVGFAQTPAAAQSNPAAEHLAAARSALNKVLNAPAPSGDAFKKLSDLKTEYVALERAASTASPEWNAHYAAIDRLLGELLGAPSASAESGAVGTTGQAGAAKGLDPGIAANLQTFRTELKAFSTAMSAVAPASSANASTAASPTSVVAGTAPKTAPLTAPAAAPVTAAASSAATAGSAPPVSSTAASIGTTAGAPADASLAAQIDPVIALVDAALGAGPVDASGKVLVERTALEQIKAQLLQIKQGAKKP